MVSKPAGSKLLIVLSLLGIAVLVALGTWQLQRLAWKQNLTDLRTAAITASPVLLTDIEAGIENGFDVDLLRVRATGFYRHDLERYVYDLQDGKIGWRIVTPFVVPGQMIVLVDRGFVADEFRAPQTRPDTVAVAALDPQLKNKGRAAWPAPVEITGYVRVHAGSAGLFTPANDAAGNRWYSYDLPAMSATFPEDLGFEPPDRYAALLPVFMQIEPGGEPLISDVLRVAPLDTSLTNNHLQYAVTWYALALVLAVMSFLFVRSRGSAKVEV